MQHDDALRVAISGKSGCGNSTVSRMLAERLGVRLINYTFHTMAEEQGISFDEMCRMAEEDDRWDRHLDETQVARAREGSCVLGSRLAIWMLPEATLRVYLEAPIAVRAARIHTREGGSYEALVAATQARDQRDHDRYLRLYGIDTDDYGFADLVVNTERRDPDEIVRLISDAVTGARRG